MWRRFIFIAVLLAGSIVQVQAADLVTVTRLGDAPEHIELIIVQLSGDRVLWQQVNHGEVLRPEESWEGANAPLVPSMRSTAYGHVNELRDPALLVDDGRVYLFYAVACESGIAVAELSLGYL